MKPNGQIVPPLKCSTCPINVGCSWGCLRGDDLCEIAELRGEIARLKSQSTTEPTTTPPVDEFDETLDVLRAAEEALAGCYQVTSYPGDGTSSQDFALARVRGAIERRAASKTSGM